MRLLTPKQREIARTVATDIVREFQDSHDEDDLREAIYDAIIEALRAKE